MSTIANSYLLSLFSIVNSKTLVKLFPGLTKLLWSCFRKNILHFLNGSLLIFWHFMWHQFSFFSHSTLLFFSNLFFSQKGRFCLEFFNSPKLISFSVLSFCSKVFIQILDKTTAREAPIVKPSFWQYQLPFLLKWTFVTANLSRSISVDLSISGGVPLD